MTHFINILFFAAILVGGLTVLTLTVREYWNEILAALAGEAAMRRTDRPWASRVRVLARPRAQAARAAQRRAAA